MVSCKNFTARYIKPQKNIPCWLLVILFLLPSLSLTVEAASTGSDLSDSTLYVTKTTRNSSSQLPEWTVMIYMDADNNLHQCGINDINEMEVIGSTSNLNIIVLFDGFIVGDSKIYRIAEDQNGYHTTIASPEIDDDGKVIPNSTKEANMVDPNTLLSFGKFVFDNYPAQHYLLSLWNHGDKLFGLSYGEDDYDANGDRIPYDKNGLSLMQISNVLKNLTDYINRKIDIIGFDACYQGFTETHYQLGRYANYSIAAEDVEPDNGWNYTFLSAIIDNPLIKPVDLAKRIVLVYDNEYKSTFSYEKFSDNYTLAAVDLNSLNNVFIPLLNNFSSELRKYMYEYQIELRNLRNMTETYDNGPDGPDTSGSAYNADLYHFAELVEANTVLPVSLRYSAKHLMDNYSRVVVASSNSSYDKNAHGLTIYFPKSKYTYDQEYQEYNTFNFANETWDEFILMYHNPKDITKPTILHAPLNQRQTIHPYNITATIVDEELDTSEIWYSTDGTNYSKIPMSATVSPNIYYGTIPAQLNNVTVYYYIEASDKSGNVATLPENASINNTNGTYSFQVLTDTLPPTIVHAPLKNISENSTFYPISADITDDFSVDKDNIFVYWKLDTDVTYTKTQMINYNESEFVYQIPKQAVGSIIHYYIEASDVNLNPNIKRLPTNGDFTFSIIPATSLTLTASIKYSIMTNESSVTYIAETSPTTCVNLTYIWSFGDGSFGFGKTTKHNYQSLEKYITNLSAVDNEGNAFGTTVTISLNTPVINFPPTLLIKENESFLFNATNSIDGDVINWTWDFGDGTIGYGPVVNHAYINWGTYYMNLTVVDNFDAKNSSHTIITVNKKPIAWIVGTSNINVGEVGFFDASASYDVDGSIVYWLWDFGENNYSYDKISSHLYAKPGTYYINLTIMDNNGAYNTTATIIFVNIPPRASIISPKIADEKQLVTFDGSNSVDDDGNIVNWSWIFGDGTVGYGNIATHAYRRNGVYYVCLTVTDDTGAKNATETTTIVRKETDAHAEGTAGEKISLYSGLDGQGIATGYRWDFGDGNITDWGNNDYIIYTYRDSGTYTARFQIIDSNNITSEWVNIIVIVKNLPPKAKICAVKQAKVGESILFDASESNGTYGYIVSYNWRFGDGAYGSGVRINHTYSEPDIYIINLTVVDNNGMQNSTTIMIQVDRGEEATVFIPVFDATIAAILIFIILLSSHIVAIKRRKQ